VFTTLNQLNKIWLKGLNSCIYKVERLDWFKIFKTRWTNSNFYKLKDKKHIQPKY